MMDFNFLEQCCPERKLHFTIIVLDLSYLHYGLKHRNRHTVYFSTVLMFLVPFLISLSWVWCIFKHFYVLTNILWWHWSMFKFQSITGHRLFISLYTCKCISCALVYEKLYLHASFFDKYMMVTQVHVQISVNNWP